MSSPKIDEKADMVSPFSNMEKMFVKRVVGKIPSFIETYHLTYMTVLWSILVVLFAYFSKDNLNWLWASSFVIFMQWVTDLFDGAVGRFRKTGLIKWGFYMDHMLDFIFMWCLIVSYVFLVNGNIIYWVFGLSFIYSCLMVSSFLTLSATGDFKITYMGVGPTEVRLLFIILNTSIIFFDPIFLKYLFPISTVILFLGFVITCLSESKKVWIMDMKIKDNK